MGIWACITNQAAEPGDDLLGGNDRGMVISILKVGMQHAVVLYLLQQCVIHLDKLPGIMDALSHLEHRISRDERVHQHQLYSFCFPAWASSSCSSCCQGGCQGGCWAVADSRLAVDQAVDTWWTDTV